MIRLNDGKPWFRRWMWISLKPITIQGLVLQWCVLIGCALFAYLAVSSDDGTWLNIVSTILFFVVGVGGLAIAFWKLEGDF